MKKLTCLLLIAVVLFSCHKQDSIKLSPVSEEVSAKILARGFNPSGAYSYKDGYVVEGDIYLSKEFLSIKEDTSVALLIAETEQYRTTNLVTGINRNITIKISGLTSIYSTALITAVGRFNALELTLRFSIITSGTANITIQNGAPGAIGLSGPPSGGNPYPNIYLNSSAIGSSPDPLYLASVIAHEMGHCIGFRHTDWFDTEAAGDFGGAIQIPGTPSGSDAGSWMLKFILSNPSSNVNVPFNANDRIALETLYPRYKVTETTCADALKYVTFQGAASDVIELTVSCGGYLNWNSAFNGAGVTVDVGSSHFQTQHVTSTSGNSVSIQGTSTMNITIPSSGTITYNVYSYLFNPGTVKQVSGSVRISKINGVGRSLSPQPALCLKIAGATW